MSSPQLWRRILLLLQLIARSFLLVESCATLLSRVLKRNLFNLFAAWCGSFSKPLGITVQIGQTLEEEKLQFSALQAST